MTITNSYMQMISHHCCGHVSETSMLAAEDVSARTPIVLADNSATIPF